ncbi:MAG: hypothetical protein MJZ16_04115 [Bacteroidales bacterium]|nr:hypothetical protein [Bacteroidales bacterium]
MIDLKTKVHDRYSIEFKMGFVAGDQPHEGDFSVGMWIFVPGSLDITPTTFTKTEFYRSVKSNIRLITPRFSLGDIVGGDALPLKNVQAASNDTDYDYQLKLFCAIVKSSLRDERDRILSMSSGDEIRLACGGFVDNCRAILASFDKLPSSKCHEYCSEFLFNTVCRYSYHLLTHGVKDERITALLQDVYTLQKEHGFPVVEQDSPTQNSDYIHRRGVLKKLVESILFLRVPKKRDGVLVEQAYYSLAAGIAMIFATVVAWAFQKYFGNLTWPLFVALIISYMMKDRIKELMRFWFAHRLSDKYYDNKAKINIRSNPIGTLKEAVDFIPLSNMPQEIEELRNRVHLFGAEDLFSDEKVILYRKKVLLDRSAMEKSSTYSFCGINDIIRIQVRPFLRKMDDPITTVSIVNEDGEMVDVPCTKDYFLNTILQYRYGDVTEFRRFRITLNRDGIKDLQEVR